MSSMRWRKRRLNRFVTFFLGIIAALGVMTSGVAAQVDDTIGDDTFDDNVGTIEGFVLNAETGEPVNGYGVNTSIGGRLTMTITDAEGFYRLELVPAGSGTLIGDRNVPEWQDTSSPVTVTAGQTARVDLTLTPRPVLVLRGTVTEAATGVPMPDTLVNVLNGGTVTIAITDALGGFEAGPLQPLETTVSVSAGPAWAYYSRTIDLELDAGPLDIVLDQAADPEPANTEPTNPEPTDPEPADLDPNVDNEPTTTTPEVALENESTDTNGPRPIVVVAIAGCIGAAILAWRRR